MFFFKDNGRDTRRHSFDHGRSVYKRRFGRIRLWSSKDNKTNSSHSADHTDAQAMSTARGNILLAQETIWGFPTLFQAQSENELS